MEKTGTHDKAIRVQERNAVLVGWALFILSALLFMVSAWRSGDWFAIAGSVAFLLANFAFLAALRLVDPVKR